jgi:hypothetical protein
VLLEINQTTIVLRDKRWIFFWKSSLIPASLVMVVMTVALIIALTAIFPDAPWEKLPAILAKKLGSVDWMHAFLGHFDMVIMFGVVFGQFFYLGRVQTLERLTLSPDGISYTSPLPRMLKRFKPDWSLPWNQVQKAELSALGIRLQGPEFALLTLISAADKRRIFPAHWVDANHYSRSSFRFTFAFKLAAPTRDEIINSLMTSEVMRYIANNVPHIAIDTSLGKTEVFTSLEKNPHGRKALGIVALLILYAIIDFVAVPDSYIDEPVSLLPMFFSAGLIGAILSGIWLYKSSLPLGEKTGLAFLIGMLVAVAMIPGALRINALTDMKGAATYDYYVTQGKDSVVLRPVVEGMPTIDYFARNAFWNKFGSNDTYPVLIRKGGLGFYQFNSSVIVADLRKH